MDAVARDVVRGLSKESPSDTGFAGGVGVLPLERPLFCSPNLINASTARSRLPFKPFNTVEFRFSSGNPMSLRVASLDSIPSPEVLILDPKTRDALFTLGGDALSPNPLRPGETPGDIGGVVF